MRNSNIRDRDKGFSKKCFPYIFLWLLLCFTACGGEKEEILIGQSEELSGTDREEETEKVQEDELEEEKAPASKIWVDVSGAVKEPGVYALEENARVFQAVEAAGGFTEEADSQWLNQAAEVSDGEKIQVYTKEETTALREQGISQIPESEENQESGNGKININQASLEELQEIPGIGEVRAQAILDFREESGGFQSIEDIQQVSGIKGKTFEKIEAYITVE